MATTITELIKKMKLIKTTNVVWERWKMVRTLVDGIRSEKIHVVSCKLNERNRKYMFNKKKPDFSDIKTWSTYDNYECITLIFKQEKNSLICIANIYDGDQFDGHRKQKRFEIKLRLPNNFVKKIESEINKSFVHYVDMLHCQHLEDQKAEWTRTKSMELLKK